jgi:putative tryptophan/tyrosine transport system substrate-binding protein
MNYTLRNSLFTFVSLALMANTASAETRKHIQAVFFEGCEKTCEGFLEGITKSNYPVDVNVIDVKQDKALLVEAMKTIESSKPDLVLLYGTSTTLALLGPLDKADDPKYIHNVPVVFTAVADPVGSKLVKSLDESGRDNVTGTYNRVPEKLNIQAIKTLDAGLTKLGMLYNANEANSLSKVKELQTLAPTMGVEIVAVEMKSDGTNPPALTEIGLGLKALAAQNVKWLYVGSSSFLNANGKVFVQQATDNNIAVVSPYPALVKTAGAVLSIAAPREEVGALAAEQALKVLRDGAKPGALHIEVATHFTYTINVNMAKKLGITTPEANHDTELVHDFFLPAAQSQ